MRIFKLLKKIRFLFVFLLVNVLLSFLLEPENGASGRMWAGYYAEKELDTIFVGSSVSQQTFIPNIFDERMGVKSYNMGTPSQAVPQSIRAIEAALEDHDIKTVVFGMGFSSLKYEPIGEAKLTFESARIRENRSIDGVVDAVSYIFSEDMRNDEDSINFLFPWLYNRESFALGTLKQNVVQKITRTKEIIQTGTTDRTDGLNKGYRNDDKSVFNEEDRWVRNTYHVYEDVFNEEMLMEFEKMLAFCNERGIDMIVLNTPHPAFDVVACHEFYEENESIIKEYCDTYGADYYDFSLVKPEIYEAKKTYYADYEHLNREGSEIFCEKLADFLNRRNNGEDMTNYFYSVDEFLEIHEEELDAWKEWKIKN